ncbi:MAG: DUF2017 family protein [Actinomycetaceae bacterium]|nr:DUF2017 family protein [Actinomycetaceae bacterium]
MITPFTSSTQGKESWVKPEFNLLLQQLIREILLVLDQPEYSADMLSAVTCETAKEPPSDPSLTHLLPPMSTDIEEAARMRALTDDFLRSEKSERLRAIHEELERAYEGGGRVVIAAEKEWEWLAALNDLRLALGGELGLETDEDAEGLLALAQGEVPDSAGRAVNATAYLLVTWWQDSLLSSMRS